MDRGLRTGITLLAAYLLLGATPALAASKVNIELMSKYFGSLGTVKYQEFTPLGGPEVGVAEIGGAPAPVKAKTKVKGDPAAADSTTDAAPVEVPGAHKLVAVKVDKGKVVTLLDETFTSGPNGEDFAFIENANLLTYTAHPWTDPQGLAHQIGDLQVRDLTASGGPKVLFALKDAVDVGFKVVNPKFQDTLIWQPQLHFLNTGERLPRRFNYSRLMWDDAGGKYILAHFLTPLPDAQKVAAANLNNKAILYYRAGHLDEAERLLSEATTQALTGQSIITHNTELVSVEIDDLARQGRKMPDRPFDPALQYYWQGQYDDALAAISRRGDAIDEFDLALSGLALAQARRWAEADKATDQLAHVSLSATGRGKAFYADYLGEMVRIALLQGPKIGDVAERYLKALENVDRSHPDYVAGIAALMQRGGQLKQTQQVLENYIGIAPGDVDLADLRLMLFELYQAGGQSTTALLADAQRGPVRNIAGYVDLVDYYDLRPALAKVNEVGDMFELSGGPLDQLVLPDQVAPPDGSAAAAASDDTDDQPQSFTVKGH